MGHPWVQGPAKGRRNPVNQKSKPVSWHYPTPCSTPYFCSSHDRHEHHIQSLLYPIRYANSAVHTRVTFKSLLSSRSITMLPLPSSSVRAIITMATVGISWSSLIVAAPAKRHRTSGCKSIAARTYISIWSQSPCLGVWGSRPGVSFDLRVEILSRLPRSTSTIYLPPSSSTYKDTMLYLLPSSIGNIDYC